MLKNPYPVNSVSARHFDKWAAMSHSDRNAFVDMCEAIPAGATHGAISAEWDVVSKMVSRYEYRGPTPAAVWCGDL